MQNSNGDVTASSLLEDLKSTDSKTKVNAIKSLKVIAFALGKERTRNELLPFLMDSIDEEEDETLIELAKILSSFLECIGGKSHASKILKILEVLLVLDEQTVRNEALNSYKLILLQINPADFENEIFELIQRLLGKEYSSYRIAGINLIAPIYPYLSQSNKSIIVNNILKFSKDESPVIKKEIASALKDFAIYFDKEIFCSIFITFLKDSNDSIKIHLMDAIISLKFHKQFDSFQEFIADSILSLSIDDGWRVRFTVADKLHETLEFPNLTAKLRSNLVEVFAKMFEDIESEIRNTCCLRLEMIAEKLGKDPLVDKILVQLKKVEKDNVPYVRGSLANSVLKVCPFIGKTKTNDFIFPVFLNLIKDENHDIRMALIGNLEKLNEVINIEIFVQSVIPSLVEISTNKSWRIRNQVVEIIPTIAKILNTNTFLDNILPLSLNCLTDSVFAIREAGCKLMKKLYFILPEVEEFEKRLMEKLNEMKMSNSYLIRNTVIFLAREFTIDETDIEILEKKLLPIVLKFAKDKISNVRLNTALTLKKISKLIRTKENLKEILSTLEELKKDQDQDVVNAIIDIQ